MALTVVALACVAAPQAYAGSIAVIDAQEILYKSNAGKRLKAALEQAKTEGQKEIAAMEAKFAKQQEELERKKSILSEDKFLEERTKLVKLSRDYNVKAQNIQDAIDQELTIGRKEISDAIRTVVNEVSAQRKFDLVMNKSQLLYHSDSVDITNDVLTMVNKRLDKKGQ